MASIYLAQALTTEHIIVKGSGTRFRDFVYVDDVVSAIETVLNRSGNNFEILNVSNEKRIYVSEILEYIEKELPNVTHEYVSGTPGDQHGIYGRNEKIKKLGWTPQITFEDGMKRMIEWGKMKMKENLKKNQ